MKKYILAFFIIAQILIFFYMGKWIDNANAQMNLNSLWDNECYEYYLNYSNTLETYVNYYYNGTTYKIRVPNTRHEFVYLDWLYNSGRIAETNKYYTTLKLNYTLRRLGLEPLYY